MNSVNTPWSVRYQPTTPGGFAAWKISTNSADDHQNAPNEQKAVNPNANAIARAVSVHQPALTVLSSQVVSASWKSARTGFCLDTPKEKARALPWTRWGRGPQTPIR